MCASGKRPWLGLNGCGNCAATLTDGDGGEPGLGDCSAPKYWPTSSEGALGAVGGHSLASVASWADDVRDARPETSNWHFVDIPLAAPKYDAARDCKNDPKYGFCIVAELDRLRHELRCATGNDQVEALKFAVHFVGDIHQPLHTVLEDKGGNDIAVDLLMRGFTCGRTCEPSEIATNFHAAWDFGLIEKIVWDWGAYVDRLEDGWLKSAEATRPGTPVSAACAEPLVSGGAVVRAGAPPDACG